MRHRFGISPDFLIIAAAILGNKYAGIRDALDVYRARQTQKVLDQPDPRVVP